MSAVKPVLGSFNPDVLQVRGRLQYDGAGVPTVIKGKGVTVIDDGAGLFTITVDKPFQHVLAAGGSRECVLAVGGTVQFIKGSESIANRTLSFRILGDADAVEDPADGDGVTFWADLQLSGLPAV